MSDQDLQSMSNIPTTGPAVVDHEGRLLGKYRLTRLLGRGGMGEVWLARDTLAKIDVAIKFLPLELRRSEDAQEQLSESYRRVHGLHHPHICAVKDLVLDPVVGFFLVMDYFEGLTLLKYRKQFIQKHSSQRLPVEELVRILMPAAEALDYAHAQGLLHRDIKPANILVSSDGSKVRVIDFQLATEVRATLSRYTNTQFDTSGTYPYMAPEQFRGTRATPAADQYSLAMTAYELLSGELPFETLGWDQWKSIVTDPQTRIPRIAGLSDQAMSALECGLAQDPKQRPATCKAFLTQLTEPTPVRRQMNDPKPDATRRTTGSFQENSRSTDHRRDDIRESAQVKTPQPAKKQVPQSPVAHSSPVAVERKPVVRPGFLWKMIKLTAFSTIAAVLYYGHSDIRDWFTELTKETQHRMATQSTPLPPSVTPDIPMGVPASAPPDNGSGAGNGYWDQSSHSSEMAKVPEAPAVTDPGTNPENELPSAGLDEPLNSRKFGIPAMDGYEGPRENSTSELPDAALCPPPAPKVDRESLPDAGIR